MASVPGAWPEYPPVAVHDAGFVAADTTGLPDPSSGLLPSITAPSLGTLLPVEATESRAPPLSMVVPTGQLAVALVELKWVVLVIAIVADWMLIVSAEEAAVTVSPNPRATDSTSVRRNNRPATTMIPLKPSGRLETS
jgi:hypothetical protein